MPHIFSSIYGIYLDLKKKARSMWNYSLVVPSALMMITLLGFYFSRPRLPLRVNNIFLGLLVIELFVLASDILSTKADENYGLFSAATLYVTNTLIFVLFLLRIFWFYRFMIQMLHIDTKKYPVLSAISALPFVIAELLCITSFATGAVFSIQETGYASGPLYLITSATYLLYIGISFGLLFANRKNIRRHNVATGFFYNLALLVGVIIRATLPKLLVMDTFCMVAIDIIYLGILNPDLYLSENGQSFNTRGLRMTLSDPSLQSNYNLLGFVLQNYNHERSILGGRQMDDIVLRIAEHLNSAFPNLMLFYLRGGRFVIMSKTTTDWTVVEQAIREQFGGRRHSAGSNLRLPIAFVHVDASLEVHEADRIINSLTIALDNAKRLTAINALENHPEVFSTKQVEQQMDILRKLERAVSNNEVEVFFQPMIDATTYKMVAAEALARIRDDDGRVISPGLFIPLAESSGLINELGKQVLTKVCVFIQSHDLDSMGIQWINVNLSPVQCLQQDLADQFSEVLARYDVSPNMIHLEITEESMLDYSLLQKQIMELDNHGFKHVMDDYGSGYSNFARVKHYPFITIKLDMSVVWDYFRDRDVLLPALVQGFKQMGLTITAEGIESDEMAQALTDIGADYLQGFYFSKPLEPDEFVARYSVGR